MDQISTQSIVKGGLDTDHMVSDVQQGFVTDCLNAINSAIDGQQISYQNEEGSVFCLSLPDGYRCIGVRNIMQLERVVYLLANPSTGHSLVGYVPMNSCDLNILLDDSIPGSDLIGFDINYPVHKIEVKTTNCSTQIYFTDRNKPRRYIDLDNLPFKTGTTNQVDTNKMNVQPDFSIPTITSTQITIGGNLIEGDYQFCIQYSNIRSEGLTSFYSVSNPVRIFLDNKLSLDFNLQANKAITVQIDNLDTTGLYGHFNLVVIKTINKVTTPELVGTYPIQGTTSTITYSGLEQSNTNIQLTLSEVMQQFEYYDLAGDIYQVDNVIGWADLVKEEDISYQKIWNQVKVLWETWQLPTTPSEGYSNGINCANLEGYMRDEVYALEGCFLFSNGKQSTRFHIPGRALIPGHDDVPVTGDNHDMYVLSTDKCSAPPGTLPKWKVYNTATLDGTDHVYNPTDDCYKGPYQFGKMGYHESTEKYPDNVAIWGPLANQPIRHHRFPDSLITHIHSNNPNGANDSYINYNNFVYPIGFKIDIGSLYNAIQTSPDLTDAEKRQIVGFKVMRSIRGDNAEIVAKGLFYNMGSYTKGGSSYYYPNYPLNDVNPDVFISSTYVNDKTGDNVSNRLNNFQKGRYTFHSPDTHFNQPPIGNCFTKMETVEYGYAKCHFVQVEDNAGEKLRSKKAIEIALAAGIISMLGINVDVQTGTSTTVTVAPRVDPQNFFPTFNNMLEILDKLTPYINYGWQYNCAGFYGQYVPVPEASVIAGVTGNKQRFIEFGGYLTSGVNSSYGDDQPINNINRESSVYVSLVDDLPYSFIQGGNPDNTRITASDAGVCGESIPFFRDVNCYYGSIKRAIPNQYGQIFSYQVANTGFTHFFKDGIIDYTDTIFGGDIFICPFSLKIKHPFYNKSTVGKPSGYDIDYDQDDVYKTNTGNVGYPIFYYSTNNKLINIDNSAVSGQITNFVNTFSTTWGIIGSIATLGLIPLIQSMILLIMLIQNGLLTTLGIKITNLDCPNGGLSNDDDIYEKGMAYLYSYGISTFYVESQINVDMRQAYNNKEGDFYPHVGGDIPDYWLQEKNVPIAFDNTYTYNQTYSKENKETSFTLLRPDWQPDQLCYINYNNRTIWSEQTAQEDTRNNWLVYKPANLFDFPKAFGNVVAVNTLETRAVLVRYQNHCQIYNAMATVETTAVNATLGTGALFSGTQPIDFPRTTTGYIGTQNKFLISTENGHIFCDAQRGKVVLVRGTATEELSGPKYLNHKWFQNNLPFNITKVFPEYPIDNAFNGVGLHGIYDNYYKRLIITKVDYLPDEGVYYDGERFYIDSGTETITSFTTEFDIETDSYIEVPVRTEVPGRVYIELGDPEYFCNKSWTISFSFLSNAWISPHSYHPNYYVEFPDFFQAGYNDSTSDIWDHNNTFSLFCNFRGVQYPYILERPYSYQYMDQLLQYIEEYATVLQYSDWNIYTEPDNQVYFTQCIVYNNQASTGLLNLIPKDMNNRAQYRQYPIYNTNSIDVLVTKVTHLYNINMLWNNQITANNPQWETQCTPELGNKKLNSSNFDYTVKSYKKYPLMAKDCKVRMIMDIDMNPYKIINKFALTQTQNVYS